MSFKDGRKSDYFSQEAENARPTRLGGKKEGKLPAFVKWIVAIPCGAAIVLALWIPALVIAWAAVLALLVIGYLILSRFGPEERKKPRGLPDKMKIDPMHEEKPAENENDKLNV